MYNGTETLINNGKYLKHSMLEFWQEYMSDIQDNMTRGTFGEFIVRSALEDGLDIIQSNIIGKAPYDLVGPLIPTLNRNARIEVKTTSNVQKWTNKAKPSFNISPAKLLDENNTYSDNIGRQRNNDIYVFCFYNSDSATRNMLDLSYWEFYVVSTNTIENDEKIWKNKTITLDTIKNFTSMVSYNELSEKILSICNTITNDLVHHFPVDGTEPHLIPCPGIDRWGDVEN